MVLHWKRNVTIPPTPGRWARSSSSVCCCKVAKQWEPPHHCCLFTINAFQVKHLIFYRDWFLFFFCFHCIIVRICEFIWPKQTHPTVLSQTKLPLRSTVTFTQENIFLWKNCKNWHPRCILQFWLPLKSLQFYIQAKCNILLLTLLIQRQKPPCSFQNSLH